MRRKQRQLLPSLSCPSHHHHCHHHPGATRMYTHHSSPPNSPPPLAQATLPATVTLPLPNSRLDAGSDHSLSSASLHEPHSPTHHGMPMSPQGLRMSSYAYCSGTTTYQDRLQGAGFTHIRTTPVNSHSSDTGFTGSSFPLYTNPHENCNVHSMNQQHRTLPFHFYPVIQSFTFRTHIHLTLKTISH